jgi:RND family efflux transporter MFP subunit
LTLLVHQAALAERGLSGFDCLIEPHAVVDLSTREEGVIEEILVDRGSLVNKADVLVRLDADIEQATVDLALARTQMNAELQELRETRQLARRELARVNELLTQKAISLTEQDRVRTEAARAGLQLRQAEQRQKIAMLELERAKKVLDRRAVRSPISGVVVDRNLSVGESVENQTIMRLAAIDPLNVEVIVPVEHLGQIEMGMLARVMPRFPGAEMREAKVTIVDSIVDAASDTFGVRLELPNLGHEIPGGVRCGIEFLPER